MNLSKDLYESNKGNESLKNGLAVSYSKLGEIFQTKGDLDKALEYFTLDMNLSKDLYESNKGNFNLYSGLGVSYFKIGAILEDLNKKAEAKENLQQAASIFARCYQHSKIEQYKEWEQYAKRMIDEL